MIIANCRYPEDGNTAATGENVIEKVFGKSGTKAVRVQVITTSKDVDVCVNGHKISPEHGYGEVWEYNYSHKTQGLSGQMHGGIESLTVKGDAQFYVNISA